MGFSGESSFHGCGVEREDPVRVAMATLVAVIAASPIVVAGDLTATGTSERDLPSGFDALDIVILDWIVAEGRRAICRGLPM